MTQCVIIIIASLVATKKSSNGLPFAPNFPSAVPNTTLNITIPRTFVVAELTGLKFHKCSGSIRQNEAKNIDDLEKNHNFGENSENCGLNSNEKMKSICLRDVSPFGGDNSVDDCARKKREIIISN